MPASRQLRARFPLDYLTCVVRVNILSREVGGLALEKAPWTGYSGHPTLLCPIQPKLTKAISEDELE
jgi:hypothetical protein